MRACYNEFKCTRISKGGWAVKNKLWWAAAAVLLVLIAVGVYLFAGNSGGQEQTYTTGKVTRGKIETSIDASGLLEPVEQVSLSANIAGTLRHVYVKENEEVRRGQTLAVIEAKTADSQLSQAESTLAHARSMYERYQKLYEEGAISYQELDDAKLAYDSAVATHLKASADMAETVIVSPMDGVVIGKPMKEGETFSQGLASQMIILQVADLSHMRIRLLVDETDIGQIREGQKVTFTVDAYPNQEFVGYVGDISRSPSDSSGSSVVYYTVYVPIEATGEDGLYPSMTARAVVHGRKEEAALLVPITALRSDLQGQFVYVVQGNEVKKTYVQIGITDDQHVEILSGLQEGETIVVSGTAGEDKVTNKSSWRVRW